MNLRWRLILPICQLLLALALHFYSFSQYRAVIRAAGGGVGMQFHERHWPAFSERIMRIVNFPVMVVALPISSISATGRTLFEYPENGGGVFLTVYDVVFFGEVAILWFWIGNVLDKRSFSHQKSPEVSSRGSGWAHPLVASLLGIACFSTSMYCLFNPSCSPPFKQITAIALVWPVALLTYAFLRIQRFRRLKRMRA